MNNQKLQQTISTLSSSEKKQTMEMARQLFICQESAKTFLDLVGNDQGEHPVRNENNDNCPTESSSV